MLYLVCYIMLAASALCAWWVTVMETQYYASICGNMLDDGWMTCDFTSFSTVVLSQDDER